MKRNEWGCKPPLCTYRMNWARIENLSVGNKISWSAPMVQRRRMCSAVNSTVDCKEPLKPFDKSRA